MMQAWRSLTRPELDRAYSARATVDDNIDPFMEEYAVESAAARQALTCRENVPYGPSEAEYFDFFPAKAGNAPLHIFIHGGYWRMLSAKDSDFGAPGLVAAGAAYAALNYALCPDVNLSEIVRQCRAAIAHLYKNAAEFGIDRDRIFISGSSAGGHLVGMMLAGDGWEEDFDLPQGVVKGGAALSGLFDLEPVAHSNVNDWVQMDAAEARSMSPIHALAPLGRNLIVGWGETETSEFKRQSLDYAARWVEAGGSIDAFEVPGRNHFNIIMDLGRPETRLGRAILKQMGLAD